MTATHPTADVEVAERFRCFGGDCAVLVSGSGSAGSAVDAAARSRRRLQQWHRQLSRFGPGSELSRLNADAGAAVPVSPVMAHFVAAAIWAARATGGLVDPTLVREVERAGYAADFDGEALAPAQLARLAPPRRPGSPGQAVRWRAVSVDRAKGVVSRPPGTRLDSGGIAKGLFGDLLASVLGAHAGFALDVAGDVRLGGTAGLVRPVQVAAPFGDGVLHAFELTAGAAATSGITRRSWLGADGRAAHHLIDPATGRPAFTGVLQVTALAPTGVEAEALSKAALLSGPERARDWLAYGGCVVYEDWGLEIVDPPDADLVLSRRPPATQEDDQ